MATPKRSSFRTVLAVVAFAAILSSAAAQTVIFVDASATGAGNGSSWADAYTSVQPALNAAQPGDQVWVAAGTYVENITLALGVGLYGGFAGTENPATFNLADRDFAVNETILDGNQGGSVVTAPSFATETTRIDGFTIRNGYGEYGGGISLADSSPTIANNVITGNTSGGIEVYPDYELQRGCGGGINSSGGNPVIIGNLIMDNQAMGFEWEELVFECVEWDQFGDCLRWDYVAYPAEEEGMGGAMFCGGGGSPTIANNTITGNSTYYGGGIYCSYSSPTIASNTITGNSTSYGGGIYCSSSSPTITNNTITGNSASSRGGGIYCYSLSPTIANNTITENSAYAGGAIYCWTSSPKIVNSTITGNFASSNCGGIYCYASSPTIANTIVAFNSSGIYKSGGTPILRYNCVYGNTAYNYSGVTDPTGTDGNISADPELADTAYGNVHIQPDSPCRDAGDDAVVQPGWLDMDGEARIQGSHVDIGADESDGTAWPAGPYAIVRVSPEGEDANDGSSWALAKRTVQAGVDAAFAAGGEVWVESGTYLERITLLPYAHVYGGFAGTETQLSERDWVANVTILDGQAGGSVVTVRAGQKVSAIDGFTIRNGSSSLGGGIRCVCASPTIANNTITGNSASSYGGGIYCLNASPTLANNTITGNSASSNGGGMSCVSSSPTIANNTISGNSASRGGGIYCDLASPTIANTIVVFNSSGIYKTGLDTPIPRHNCVHGNPEYNYSGMTDPTGTDGNISTDPLFVQTPGPGPDSVWGTADDDPGDVRLLLGSPCIDTGDNAYAVGDYDLDGNPRIVDGNGDGVDVVDMGAYEYHLIPGDCNHDGSVNILDVPDFTACLTGPNVIVSPECACADFNGDDHGDLQDFAQFQHLFSSPPRLHVNHDASGAGTGQTWDDAYTDLQDALAAAPTGSQVWVAAGTYRPDGGTGDRTVSFELPGGVEIYGGFAGGETSLDQRDVSANPTVLSGDIGVPGDISDNSYHVVYVDGIQQTAVLDGLVITDGHADGSAGTHNVGAGVRVIASNVALRNCAVRGNNASGNCGGIQNLSGTVLTLDNCVISGNTSGNRGAGIQNYQSAITATNCTIVNNAAAAEGGGVFMNTWNTSLTNCIVWGNTAMGGVSDQSAQIHILDGTLAVNYSCVQYWSGTYGGIGNLGLDPLFATGPWGDYYLSQTAAGQAQQSPCVDAGDPASALLPGTTRTDETPDTVPVDMGYHY